MAGGTSSSGDLVDAFGGLAARKGKQFNQQYAKPLSQGFGWNPGAGFLDNLESKAAGGNPFASWMMDTRSVLPEYMADAKKAGAEIASRAPGAFNAFMGQAEGYLNDLLGFRQGVQAGAGAVDRAMGDAGYGVDMGRRFLDEAASPIASQALYRNALSDATRASNAAAAGRGLIDSGSAQGREESLARGLASDFAARRASEQQAALAGYGGATGLLGNLGLARGQLSGLEADLARSGIDVSSGIMQALPAYGELLRAGSAMPFGASQDILGFLGATQNPTLALLQATAPQVAQESKGWNVL